MHSDMTGSTNPLGREKIGSLLFRFAVPSVIAMLVNALYNIIDQIFIGQGVGLLGNAATNVAFPLSTFALAISLLLAQGCASKQNLELGAGNRPMAEKAVGNTVVMCLVAGIGLFAVLSLFFRPMLIFFGATDAVLPYAAEYTQIVLIGVPFTVLSTGINAAIRADGSPTYAMLSILSGAIINCILDPIFIFSLGWGMAGAAWATIIGQAFSCMLTLLYIPRFKHIRLHKQAFKPDFGLWLTIPKLGFASFANQISIFVVQIVLNNSLRYYGELSNYGADIPLACAGIVSKCTMIFFAIIIGIAQGSQPIISFNYGARQYGRVKEAYEKAAVAASCAAVIAFLIFQFFPNQLIKLFGDGSAEYIALATRFFRVNQFAIFLNGIQPTTGTFFTSIGKAVRGSFVSLTRQILFLLPLIGVLPIFLGVEGILFAAPIADVAAFMLAILLVRQEFKKLGLPPLFGLGAGKLS